ncbi:hypothetical protein THII_3408 [Thioploca ingrica]|uniref:DUF29 domain-containing protein n=1 Tax=Thioploca ingrica TaxID=40754 RepID=A0A090AQ28_9GAMM|nr:hypothetical protein THII_3408 [Thioploca ingrica]
MNKTIDYETDLYSWALHNAELLRQGRFAEIDAEHIAEELEDRGKSDRRALENRLIILVAHLLKWEHQPDHRSGSWEGSINEQRLRVNRLLRNNPGLKPYLPEAVANAYADALKLAAKDTHTSVNRFPSTCPYTLEQMLHEDFYPEN